MSTQPDTFAEHVRPPETYTGSERYVRIAEDFLGVTLTEQQAAVLRALAEHERVHVPAGNGVGKSFVAAVANGAFLLRHPESIAMPTSGTYSVLTDTIWKPLRRRWRERGLPGRTLESPPRIEIDDEWYFKAVSPRNPGNLEGRHAADMLVTIEEADKPDITPAHLDSVESLKTSPEDRLLVINNPPRDESNLAHDLAESGDWHTLRLSSLESHNVRVAAGELDTDPIDGLVTLDTIREDWKRWNGEDWPGLEAARTAHQRRDDLDARWYRRRAGVMPPQGASAHRPVDVHTVNNAYDRQLDQSPETPSAVGIDVARSGDETVMYGVHDRELRCHYAAQGANHAEQERRLRDLLDEWPQPDIAIDAVGEGSGLADRLDERYPTVRRFDAGSTPIAATDYRNKWAEALAHFGDYLAGGGAFTNTTLRRQALVGARTVTFGERHLASRGHDGATVLEATPKEDVKADLGHSPDHLDAAAMAVWAAETDPTAEKPSPTW